MQKIMKTNNYKTMIYECINTFMNSAFEILINYIALHLNNNFIAK